MKNGAHGQRISFSAEMITAILNNRKTQTRILKETKQGEKCPYGNIGDKLWVKEPFALVPGTAFKDSIDVVQTINPENPGEVAIYAAGWQRTQKIKWSRPSKMPYWAHRIDLVITDIRTQNLQDITSKDALREGFPPESPVHAFAAFWGKKLWDENPFVWIIDFKVID